MVKLYSSVSTRVLMIGNDKSMGQKHKLNYEITKDTTMDFQCKHLVSLKVSYKRKKTYLRKLKLGK